MTPTLQTLIDEEAATLIGRERAVSSSPLRHVCRLAEGGMGTVDLALRDAFRKMRHFLNS